MNVERVDFEGALNQLADLEKSFNIELEHCGMPFDENYMARHTWKPGYAHH